MGTLPSPNPSRSPVANALNPSLIAIANTAPGIKSPSFEEVSKLFSLPLSDAADSLGVCPSVLKKVCYDNGLVRWPYRKFLAGKSIEEIKQDAAKNREKQLAESKLSGQSDSLTTSTISTSLAPQPQSTNTSPLQQTQMLTQQPSRENQIETSPNMHRNKGSTPTMDEFKYGFPSDGLSSTSYRWWGSSQKSTSGDAVERKPSLEVIEDKTDANVQWATSLSDLRKRAAQEGQRALKLGVYRGYDVKTLDRTKKMALIQIFKSSLPHEWGDLLSES